ncbi:MAG TPA: DedA family protein [Candidatus Nanoarchaeia archaeon]|nr:protein DedA [uncultured archaeon]
MENLLNLDLKAIIEAVGYLGVFAMVFAESGLLIGIVLPGDSLLFTAGFLASAGVFNIFFLSLGSFLAAVLGDNVGYSFGRRIGPRIFNQEDSFWFHKNHLLKAENFYRKHGGKAVVLARFLPIVRTFAPIVAGVGKMNYQTFLFYNLIGGFLWAVGVTVSGYFLGRLIPDVDKYLLPILLSIIIISLLPTVVHLLSSKFKN